MADNAALLRERRAISLSAKLLSSVCVVTGARVLHEKCHIGRAVHGWSCCSRRLFIPLTPTGSFTTPRPITQLGEQKTSER